MPEACSPKGLDSSTLEGNPFVSRPQMCFEDEAGSDVLRFAPVSGFDPKLPWPAWQKPMEHAES